MREEIKKQYEKFKGNLALGQVVCVHKNKYEIQNQSKKYVQAVVSGRFRYHVIDASEYPVVGDYVVYRESDNEEDLCIIEHVLERYAELARLHEWQGKKQLLAANMDKIFICVSLNNDYNVTKIQNLLSLTYGSNAETIILLTKNDLIENNEEIL
ncbi:MAG: GTPase RsgA, partial [Firmicutes bacterium]|nr:GTPase RsgA [Bacillota bacterium]